MASKRKRGRPAHDDILTPAEWRTVHAAQHGMTNREIAARRGVSVDAVKYHMANVRDKLGLGGKAALRDWHEVPADSALRKGPADMSETQELGAIGQISRTVTDLAASIAWYRDILGLKYLFSFGDIAFFDCGGIRLFLSEKPDGATPESILYFRVADIVAVHGRLRDAGVTVVSAPHRVHKHEDGTEEWMAFFNDPDGRPLGLMAQVGP